MEISYSEIALIMGGVMAGFKLLERGGDFLYKIITKGNNKEKTDTQQEIQLAVFKERFLGLEKQLTKIETNDLYHNSIEHKEMKEIMYAMKTDIAVIKDKILDK